jgi:acyl carrier protein
MAERQPRDDVERRVTEIWEQVFGGPVEVDRDFFEAGGNSLLAIRMLNEVADRFGTKLPLTAVFEAGTIEHLAALLRTT